MPPRKRFNSETLGEDSDRIVAATEVADRNERKKLLSGILRDGKATGAEAVAAARLLEAMERTDTSGAQQGIPSPTSRPEQIARILRVLNAAPWQLVGDALEIFISRIEKNRQAAVLFNPEANANNIQLAHAQLKRLRAKKLEEKNAHRKGIRPESESSGTSSTLDGLPELHQTPASVGETTDSNESSGARDSSPSEET